MGHINNPNGMGHIVGHINNIGLPEHSARPRPGLAEARFFECKPSGKLLGKVPYGSVSNSFRVRNALGTPPDLRRCTRGSVTYDG
jgi:hypothetical protein